MNSVRFKQILSEEIRMRGLLEGSPRPPAEEPAAELGGLKTAHVDRSLGYFIADYLKKRFRDRRFRESIISKMEERDDLYAPSGRTGLTDSIVQRTTSVVIEQINAELREMIEDVIRQLMMRWRVW